MMNNKLFRIATVSISLNSLLNRQLAFLNNYYDVVGIASGKEGLKEISEREKIRTIHVPMRRDIKIFADLRSLFILIYLFLKERPFIVHANTPKASLLSMIAAWVTRVPNRIYTVTGLRFETATGIFRVLLITMEKITCWCATKVIPEGEGVKKTLLREKITTKELKIILHGSINGIDVQYFNCTDEIELAASELRAKGIFTFCYVGRMVKDKGINELIHAFIRLYQGCHDIRLFLVGPFEKKLDPIYPEVESIILNHPAIFFFDFKEDIRPYLVASNALVFPSYREGFPNVVLQAGAMGLPSIVTDINGCNEIIQDGINGKIIPPHDENALYDAMMYFVQHCDNEIITMSRKARSMVIERFEQKKNLEALLKEYRSLEL